MLKNQTDSTQRDFSKYLESLGISKKSHKNYRSDLSHFTGWAILKIRSFGSYVENLTEALPFLGSSLAAEYKNYMIENATPTKTANRRLSTLRHLARFLVATQLTDFDFMEHIENISTGKTTHVLTTPVIDGFKSFLEAEKVSKSTVKNYVSDVRQFLVWLETNQLRTN
jgi:site-specific recombinase XerD